MQFDRKLQLATDLYQFTMGNVYLQDRKAAEEAVFDVFIRENPFGGGYTVAAGLEQVIEYVKGLHFTKEDTILLKKNHQEFKNLFGGSSYNKTIVSSFWDFIKSISKILDAIFNQPNRKNNDCPQQKPFQNEANWFFFILVAKIHIHHNQKSRCQCKEQ